MESTVEKRERIRNEKITMKRASYQARMGRSYNKGRVDALLMIGYSVPEIADLLNLNESSVRSIHGELKSSEEGI